jgi:nucleotide-binding universal stress UspA family protein
MIRTMLAALDGSRLAELALAQAGRLARQTGATILLVRVAPPFTTVSESLASPGSGTIREADVYLNAVVERMGREGLTVRLVALHGLAPMRWLHSRSPHPSNRRPTRWRGHTRIKQDH